MKYTTASLFNHTNSYIENYHQQVLALALLGSFVLNS